MSNECIKLHKNNQFNDCCIRTIIGKNVTIPFVSFVYVEIIVLLTRRAVNNVAQMFGASPPPQTCGIKTRRLCSHVTQSKGARIKNVINRGIE